MLEIHAMPTKKRHLASTGWGTGTYNQRSLLFSEGLYGRVISNRLDFSWPAKSPDLNPLDYFFWGAAEAEVNKKKPKTICDLKKVVEDYANQFTRDTLHRVADNFMERVKICYQEDRGHFEGINGLSEKFRLPKSGNLIPFFYFRSRMC